MIMIESSFFHLTKETSNKKLGSKVAASTSSKNTCPSLCPWLIDGSCYAAKGPQSWHWAKVSKGRGSNWWNFCSDVMNLKRKQLFRLNVSGDLVTNQDGLLDEVKLSTLIRSCEIQELRGWTYTHTHLVNKKNLDIILNNKSKNFTINLSTEDRYQAAEYHQQGHQVSVVDDELFELSSKGYEVKLGSTLFMACPEQYKGTKCSECKACINNSPSRPVVIFKKH